MEDTQKIGFITINSEIISYTGAQYKYSGNFLIIHDIKNKMDVPYELSYIKYIQIDGE